MTAAVRRMFAGRTVLLTGAASGLGKALCAELLEAGAKVHAADISAEGLEALAEEHAAVRDRLFPAQLDVRDREAYAALAGRIEEQSGGIDFLFNNAGVTLLGEAQNLPFERWKWLLDINLMGVVNGIHAVYPRMVARKRGTIVSTASIAGSTGYATAAAYTTSKAAVLELTRSLAAEAKIHGVRVTAACPGYVNSNIFQQDRIVGADREAMIRDLPVKMMSPQEAARLYLKGLTKNVSPAVFPFTAKLLWVLSKWAPTGIAPFHRQLMKTFRRP